MSATTKAQPLPSFMAPLACSLALLVLLQFVGRTTWMLVPPGILAIGGFLPLSRMPGIFFVSLPASLLLETTGKGPEELLDALLSPMGFRNVGQPALVDMQVEDIFSLLLWLAITLVWIHGFRELTHLAMTKGDPFPGPKGRTGPSPLPRTMPVAADRRRFVTIGVLAMGAGILVVVILQAASLSEEVSYAAILRARLGTLGGGGILVFMAVRALTGYMHWRAMPALEAGMVAQEGAWREGSREFTALDRWLTWARLGARRRAERQWKQLTRRRKTP